MAEEKHSSQTAQRRSLLSRLPKFGWSQNIKMGAFIGVFAISGAALLILSRAAVQVSSVKSGNWNDATTWSGGHIPQAGDTVIVETGHTVTFNIATSPTLGETQVKGTLAFSPNGSATLMTEKNMIVTGKLEMKPADSNIIHTLRFVNVNETQYVGGGMVPLATDVGLWVMDNGQLDLVGSPKKAWTRTTGSANQGATSLSLKEAPVGWLPGDDLAISPTALGNYSNFDPTKVASVSGSTVSLTGALTSAHPSADFNNKSYTPEVMNLTRNVRIEGTKPAFEQPRTGQNNTNGGRAHIFVRSTKPQTVNYVQIQYMGPRKSSTNCWITENCSSAVLGRYGLHFHHSFNGTRGSTVQGTVLRDIGANGFVPHASSGMTFSDTIAYSVYDNAYWWDAPFAPDENNRICVVENCADGVSGDTIWERAIAAHVKHDATGSDTAIGFALQKGLGNAVRDSVAVGVQGQIGAGGYGWLEGSAHSPWQFNNNVAHNNVAFGITWWQVDEPIHPVEKYISYRNGTNAVQHGAYLNNAHYLGFESFEDAKTNDNNNGEAPIHSIAQNAGSVGPVGTVNASQLWRDGFIDVGGQSPYGVHFQAFVGLSDPIRLERIRVKGYTNKPVLVREVNDEGANDGATRADLICWSIGDSGRDLEPSDIDLLDSPQAGMPAWDTRAIIRVQRKDGTAFQFSGNKQLSTIPKFSDCGTAPTDTTRPSAPVITAATYQAPTSNTPRRVILDWTPSTDNVGVKEYRIIRVNLDRSFGQLSTTNQLIDTNLSTATSQILDEDASLFYNVVAVDHAGNISDTSKTIEIKLTNGEVYIPPSTTTPPPPPPPPTFRAEDINQDGIVNILDFSLLSAKFGQSSNLGRADINGDGLVNILDFSLLASKFGT